MPRVIRPFDDSRQKDRRRATEDASTDTAGFDPYRQGVELVKPSDFALGIVKISDGYNEQTGDHHVPQLVYGQERPVLRDISSFEDVVKFDPIARILEGPPSGPPPPPPSGFDPTTLAFSLALRGSYSGLPWNGLATAGTSGPWNAVTTGAPDPTVGTALNGYTPADYDGATTRPTQTSNGITTGFFSDFASPSAYYFAALVYVRTAPPDISGGTNPYLNPCIIADDGGAMGIGLSSSGVQGFHDDGGVYIITGWAPLSLNAWHWVEWWYDGSNIHIAVDGVAGTPSGATATASYETLETLRIGTNYSGVPIDGLIEEVWAAPTDLSAHSADMISYVNSRYGLSV